MFHWCTPKYSHHLALDKVHGRLQDHVDKFVEVYLARSNKQPVKPFNINITAITCCSNLVDYYETQIENLKKIKTSLKGANELHDIVEGMIADINQHIYLLKLE